MIISKRHFLFIYSFTHSLIYSFVSAQAPKTYTSSEILLQLKKLNTVGAVLYIAAHPDDENTRLISYLANEKCLRTGYLSLTRGDGGQNLIGPEQGIELGVIRTQELLAARRIDGGEQFFTRAYDFGFSKSPEETFTKWNRDSVLSDMVWVIRNFRPDIIITRFATDGSGGHGHHTASAILAEEAFDAAADPSRFPEQLKYVSVWKTRRMFHNSTARFFNPNADLSHLIKLDVGGYNPLLGKSYGEIAAESRSMHKSQGFGSARQRGESFEYFKPVKGDTAGLKDIFEGIDFSWMRDPNGKAMKSAIDDAIKKYDVLHPEKSMTQLNKIADIITNRTKNDVMLIGKTPLNGERFYLLGEIMYSVNGFYFEALSKSYNIALGDTLHFNLNIANRSQNLFKFENVQMNDRDSLVGKPLLYNKLFQIPQYFVTDEEIGHRTFEDLSKLYWLEKPLQNNLFNTDIIGLAEMPQYYDGDLLIENDDHKIVGFHQGVQYKWVDPEKGELYRPVVITPPVMINITNNVLTFSDNETKEFKITIRAGKDSVQGSFGFPLPESWKVECTGDDDAELFISTRQAIANDTLHSATVCTYSLLKKGEEKTYTIKITPTSAASNFILKPFLSYQGKFYTKGIKEIKYDHIPVQTLFPEAEIKLVKLDVVRKSKRIGYIPGAGDEVQASLSQLGYEVVTLTDAKLANDDLKQYDAIITGVRAYNTNDKLPAVKQKLMEYVKSGGNLIVQYNTNSWAGPLSSDIGPYKFKITRNRITDETAKVEFLLPNHPVFNTPNKIAEKDFEGWIQERSIYHAGEWDSNYVAPISMTDPYEMTVGNVSPKGKPDNGALIIGKYGKGNFIYTGLVFFRELPAGVPGAYRFMVNLIELGK